MKVHGKHAVCTGGGKNVGDEFSGDRIAGTGFAVLTSVAEVRNDGGDTTGGRAAHSVDHDQKLDEVVVDRGRSRLDNEYVATSDRFVDLDAGFSVGELADLNRAERHV